MYARANLHKPTAVRARLVIGLLLLFAAGPPSGHAAAPSGGALPPFWEELASHANDAMTDLQQGHRLKLPGVMSGRMVRRCRDRITAAIASCARGMGARPIGCTGPITRSALALGALGNSQDVLWPAATQMSNGVGRFALLLRTVRRRSLRDCRPAPIGRVVPAVATWLDQGRRVVVEPVAPLPVGTRYRLQLPEILQVADFATRFTADGRLAPEPPSGHEDTPVLRFIDRSVAAGAEQDGVTVRPQLLLRFEPPIDLRQVRLGRRMAFVPLTDAEHPPGAFRTVMPPLLADAERVKAATPTIWPTVVLAPDSAEAHGLGIPATGLPHVSAIVQGSIDIPDPVSGKAEVVPYVITLPPRGTAPVPVVLLLHGLNGTGPSLLFQHADALAARGLAAAAIDFPLHGARKGATVFLDPLDAATFAVHTRHAISDVLYVVAALRAGRLLPPELALPAPVTVRLLGYSLGAMVGAAALGLDQAIGTSVLMAPAGDHTDWLWLPILQGLAVPPQGCVGGPMQGVACRTAGECNGGSCSANPVVSQLMLRYTMSYRSALAGVDPQTFASRAGGVNGRRAVLLEEGGIDGIVVSRATEWLAAALHADPTCRVRPEQPRTLCRFAGAGHELEGLADVRAVAYAFLASDGAQLGDGAPNRADLAAR